MRSALHLVANAPHFVKEVELWSDDESPEAHSLHYVLSLPGSFRPELAYYFISKFSKRGDVILDPFAGVGTTALEANLTGRIAYTSDNDPLAVMISQAKLEPKDLTEVTLCLQLLNLKRPVELKNYREYFSSFYEVETFRELQNLRAYLQDDKVAGNARSVNRFVELICLSLLHGHSAGHFSVYTLPQICLSPSAQDELNVKRNQTADYRSVVPRVLRKAAAVLRDGIPSFLRQIQTLNRIAQTDARDLNYVPTGTVDLVVTGPPVPGDISDYQSQWLKYWFAGLPERSVPKTGFGEGQVSAWLEFMNEVLFELARVVKSGGRAVLDVKEIQVGREMLSLDAELVNLIETHLDKFWEPESTLVHKDRIPKLKHVLKERDPSKLALRNRLLVLRRK